MLALEFGFRFAWESLAFVEDVDGTAVTSLAFGVDDEEDAVGGGFGLSAGSKMRPKDFLRDGGGEDVEGST